jgi:hypothetical protein
MRESAATDPRAQKYFRQRLPNLVYPDRPLRNPGGASLQNFGTGSLKLDWTRPPREEIA